VLGYRKPIEIMSKAMKPAERIALQG
ncbi:MAG: hypothetical protein JWM09_927, partial [Francisellaceae bacterium]|nr:hypothetical protein [Francisellaceae bacterium]